MIVGVWWFRFLVRAALAVLASWALSFAQDRYDAFRSDFAANFRYDGALWLAWVGPLVAAGLLFGLAAWLPFTSIRILPSRLLLAAFALTPLAHSWWLIQHPGGSGWLRQVYWFDMTPIQFASGVLAGVALASVFGARLPRPD